MIINPRAAEGETIWKPSSETITSSAVTSFTKYVQSNGHAIGDDYASLWRWSVDNLGDFWRELADYSHIELGGEEGASLEGASMRETIWFPGRTLNYAQHILKNRNGVALTCLSEQGDRREFTWPELREEVAAFAHYLSSQGVERNDTVVAVLPNVAEAVIGLLATASLGAIWSICAPEFGAGAIVSRFAQLKPKILIAAPGYFLGGKDRDRATELSEIVTELTTLQSIVWVTEHTQTSPPATKIPSTTWQGATATQSDLNIVEVEFNHPLWVLFSSGTTGIPKGIVHSHGGALLELMKMLQLHSDLKPGDKYFSVASTSWVVWNALVSAMGVGATSVLLDGNPTFPSLDKVWKVAAEEKAATLGLSAGFVHACLKQGLNPAADFDLSHLRCIQVTGSPLSPDGYRWVYQNVGDVWLSSMSGGTDIASIFVGGTNTLPVNVGYIQAPALGVNVECWNEAGLPVEGKGELVITKPMPSMPLYLWGDEDGSRYFNSYYATYPEIWRHGDYVEFAKAGILIHGRSDSTLNRNGIRLGSADIYSAVEAVPEVAEALVIGAEMGTDYYMPLFVSLVENADPEKAKTDIETAIRKYLSVRYLPDEIIVMPAIPHTRTGKKLEVPIKRLIQGEDIYQIIDTQSVDNPDLLDAYVEFVRKKFSESARS